jgi:glycosyltransferase involved in cell wall biosynthesis
VILSVVIPTHNKQDLLVRTLSALARQTLPGVEWEVIVVNDGSTDGTERVLAESELAKTHRLQVVRPAQNVGRAAARNLGLRHAAGRWILFLDDDILAPPQLLATHLSVLEANPGCGTIGHVTTAAELIDSPHFHYIDSRGVAKIKTGVVPARYFVTQNAAVPRQPLLEIGGFDESFAAYGMEDMEVAFRLEDRHGIVFLPIRSPVPTHVHHHTFAQYLAKKREAGQHTLPLLGRLHPHRLREMRLHWIFDPASEGKSPLTAVGHHLAHGPLASLLGKVLLHWPTHGPHRPFLSPLYCRCLDGLILCAYSQGLTARFSL